ncbi:hypothetical protein ONE63_009492 [Megalurothrips usitatus]|uniref:Attacin C-terminal domain-containing protein n=1 Tax=Megalurothrips usitatus TaxID=439358 RepID=A0AAV7XNW3_9NEOP|nr:hypothetical protein ONE63_009492 [Megalurothrips usitatus]
MRSLIVLVLLGVVLAAAAPSPFQPTVRQPGPARQDHGRRGEVSGGIDRQKGVGTVVHGRGSGDAWVSRDGNTRVNVGGHYGRVVSGPAKGAKDYGGHVNLEHRF